jgi:hypothetical protein
MRDLASLEFEMAVSVRSVRWRPPETIKLFMLMSAAHSLRIKSSG